MASLRRIEANRRNAQKSTGPRTDDGKSRARCNAIRHGLTAETVLELLEDTEDYKAFEASVTADFDAQTAVERELVLRLVSLLWRLRRAIAIETGLFHMHADAETEKDLSSMQRGESVVRFGAKSHDDRIDWNRNSDGCSESMRPPYEGNLELAGCFLRLTTADNGAFDRLHRYETALWRQVGQVLFTLEALQGRAPFRRNDPPPYLGGPRR